ncbi:MAG: ribonuclease Z [Lachnospiraceae bacterium]|nr:ribonuclease Z [Lachnospiraceae bacterium]
MLDVCLLGTGGMMPLPYRWLTSLMMRYNGKSILIDCGEGTQIAMREKGWSPNPIDIICFTHYHADHISGLPGMLLTMGNAERKEPLLLIGPKGLERVVNALRVIAPELPFEIQFLEITADEESFYFDGFRIDAFKVKHNVLCYGYSMCVERAGRFDRARAEQLQIPMQYWSRLQKGETIEAEGRTFTPDMVLGADRKGLKVTYCTDTRPTDSILQHAREADLLILEGMYGEPDKLAKAKEHKHMTMYEAARIAREAQVPELWLTHYSPSLMHPEEFIGEVRNIFPNTIAAKDGRTVELNFKEE